MLSITSVSRGLAASSLLCFGGALLAQGDECVGALAVGLGTNGPFTNVGSTTSAPVWPCASGENDVWFIHFSTCSHRGTLTATTCGADFDTAIEVFDGSQGCGNLVSLGCNDDFCGRQSGVSWPSTYGGIYYIRVGGWTGETGNFPLTIDCDYGLFIEGVAEAIPYSGTLAQVGGQFSDGDTIRWNYADTNNLFTGKFAASVLNLGNGAPVNGVTPQIPGLDMLWLGSWPSGNAFILPPHQVGAADYELTFPSGLFWIGDLIRVQGIVLDPANAAGALPVVPTTNTIEWTFLPQLPCVTTEDFEGTTNGAGNYPTGWSDGGGTLMWVADSGGTGSAGTGPSAAVSGTQYMYCETSSPATTGSTWIMNSRSYLPAEIPGGAVSFQLSRVGATIGTLEVRMDDGTNTFATLLGSFTGESANEWEQVFLVLPTPLPATMVFQFHYTYGGSFTGDLAVDDFCTH